jgi:hypothetical protein
MHRVHSADRLDLDDDTIFHHEVEFVSALHINCAVSEWECYLISVRYATMTQLLTQTGMIG